MDNSRPPSPNSFERFITKPPIKRILKKANISRISKDVDEAIYKLLVEYTAKILQTTLVFTDHAPRKTIQMTDLEAGFQQNNQRLAIKLKKPLKKVSDTPVKSPKTILFPGQEIPFNNFKELCKNIVNKNEKEYRFGAWVFVFLQYVVETYIYELSVLAAQCASHANHRKTVRASDFYLARNLRGW